MLKNEITIDDLQEQHKEYAAVIGLDNLIALSENFGGTQIYIPKKDELIKNKKYKAILDEYDGTNIRLLATKYEVSESTVYRIVRDKIIRNDKTMEGQLSFADCFGHL